MKYKKLLQDFKIEYTKDGYYDFAVDETTRTFIEEDHSLTPVLVSIFEKKRQTSNLSDDYPFHNRGGSYFPDSQRGSLLWTINKVLNNNTDEIIIKNIIGDSVQWMISDYVDSVEIETLDFNIITRDLYLALHLIVENKKEKIELNLKL